MASNTIWISWICPIYHGGRGRGKVKNVLCQGFVAVTFVWCVSPGRAVMAAVVNGIPVALATASAAAYLTRQHKREWLLLTHSLRGNSCDAKPGRAVRACCGHSQETVGWMLVFSDASPCGGGCQHAGGMLRLSVNPCEIPSKTLPRGVSLR